MLNPQENRHGRTGVSPISSDMSLGINPFVGFVLAVIGFMLTFDGNIATAHPWGSTTLSEKPASDCYIDRHPDIVRCERVFHRPLTYCHPVRPLRHQIYRSCPNCPPSLWPKIPLCALPPSSLAQVECSLYPRFSIFIF